MKYDLREIIIESCKKGTELQAEDGSMPAGQNYTYGEEETPVQNTANWAKSFFCAYDLSRDEKFLNSAERCYDYLLSREARPRGETFFCRKEGRDKCNGVIGQGTVIDSLVTGSEYFEDKGLCDVARDVFSKIPFDRKRKLWRRTEVDGRDIGVDNTLNHQISFASSIVGLSEREKRARLELEIFLDGLEDNMEVRKNGRIKHLVKQRSFVGK